MQGISRGFYSDWQKRVNQHSNIKQDILTILMLDDLGEHLPRVEIGIAYKANLDHCLSKTGVSGNHTF